MAIYNLSRGGDADFKGWMCAGQWSEYGPPYSTPLADYTPPFNSHADGAYGQGYLNLHFPLVPNLAGTYGHKWMQNALRSVNKVNDIILLAWVPLRSYVDSLYVEVTRTDASLDDLYIKPVAYRTAYNFTTDEWEDSEVTDFATELTNAGITKLPLGTPDVGDTMYCMARLGLDATKKPSTFGHNIVKYGADGKPESGVDDYFGAVRIGFQFVEGSDEKVASVWKSDIAVHMSAKLLSFEGAMQIG